MYQNTTGYQNTAIGTTSQFSNITGWQNTSVGAESMYSTTGNYNTAVGYNTDDNISMPVENYTCIGTDATATGNNMVRIGNVWVTSIGGYVNWSNISDERFKEQVAENVPGLRFIEQLRPVTYRLNREKLNDFTGVSDRHLRISETNPDSKFLSGDPFSPVTTGFIAQEVEQAARNLGFEFSGVDRPENANGLYGLRYAEFVVPLVKAVQEQQHMINKQKKLAAGQDAVIAAQGAKLESQEKRLLDQQKQIDELKSMVDILLKKTDQ